MSVHAIAWAWEQPVGSLMDRTLLLAIADFADNNHQCYPSQSLLAARLMCSVDTVQRALGRLEKTGLVHRKKRGRADGGRTSDLLTLAVSTNIEGGVKPQNAVKGLSRIAVRHPPTAQLCGRKNRQLEPLPAYQGEDSSTLEVEGYARGYASAAEFLAEIPE